MTNNHASAPGVGDVADRQWTPTSHLNWSAIFAGSFVAVASSSLLLMFGGALGLSIATPWQPNGWAPSTWGLATLIWFALVHLYAIGLGSYLAGRLRPRINTLDRTEVQFRDGANGLVVWALAILASIVVSIQLASTVVSTATNVSTGVISGIAQSGHAVANVTTPILEDAVFKLYRRIEQRPGQQVKVDVQPNDPKPIKITYPSSEERRAVLRTLAKRLLDGELSSADKTYISNHISRYTGLQPAQALERLDETMVEARKTAKKATETARQSLAMAGFWSAFIFLLSGALARWAATLGGNHRDDFRA